MPKFSHYFNLGASQAQLDFVDIDNEKDTPVYVDPYAIEIRSDDWSNSCSEAIRGFFDEVLLALRSGNDGRANNLMSQLHEPAETFLGISKGIPKGRGVGQVQAQQLVASIRDSAAFSTGRLEDLSEMALYVDGINRDKVSDLTTNIIRDQLVSYTKSQCDMLDIPCSDYNGPPLWNPIHRRWESRFVKLPRIDDSPVMLVPKIIVRKTLSLEADEFYKKQLTDFLVSEQLRVDSGLVHLIRTKKKIQRKVYKGEVREKYPKSKSYIAEIIEKHPDLLETYKKIAAERPELVTTSDDDMSVAAVCVLVGEKLKLMPSGPKNADEYHRLIHFAITLLFYPKLILPKREWRINSGRKRIDIVFTNDAREGFLQQRREASNTAATNLIVECKNYSDDIANEEIDQLHGRFDDNRGYLGFVTCRKIDNRKLVMDKCRDFAKSGKSYILVVEDTDFLRWLDWKSVGRDKDIDADLHSMFRDLIA